MNAVPLATVTQVEANAPTPPNAANAKAIFSNSPISLFFRFADA